MENKPLPERELKEWEKGVVHGAGIILILLVLGVITHFRVLVAGVEVALAPLQSFLDRIPQIFWWLLAAAWLGAWLGGGRCCDGK